jgi:hypothetical protein
MYSTQARFTHGVVRGCLDQVHEAGDVRIALLLLAMRPSR